MVDDLKIFHGSSVVVQNPKVMINGYYKDFGCGFYLRIWKSRHGWSL
ncbi:DUF3990 domain-containing protein [Emergencia sp.]